MTTTPTTPTKSPTSTLTTMTTSTTAVTTRLPTTTGTAITSAVNATLPPPPLPLTLTPRPPLPQTTATTTTITTATTKPTAIAIKTKPTTSASTIATSKTTAISTTTATSTTTAGNVTGSSTAVTQLTVAATTADSKTETLSNHFKTTATSQQTTEPLQALSTSEATVFAQSSTKETSTKDLSISPFAPESSISQVSGGKITSSGFTETTNGVTLTSTVEQETSSSSSSAATPESGTTKSTLPQIVISSSSVISMPIFSPHPPLKSSSSTFSTDKALSTTMSTVASTVGSTVASTVASTATKITSTLLNSKKIEAASTTSTSSSTSSVKTASSPLSSSTTSTNLFSSRSKTVTVPMSTSTSTTAKASSKHSAEFSVVSTSPFTSSISSSTAPPTQSIVSTAKERQTIQVSSTEMTVSSTSGVTKEASLATTYVPTTTTEESHLTTAASLTTIVATATTSTFPETIAPAQTTSKVTEIPTPTHSSRISSATTTDDISKSIPTVATTHTANLPMKTSAVTSPTSKISSTSEAAKETSPATTSMLATTTKESHLTAAASLTTIVATATTSAFSETILPTSTPLKVTDIPTSTHSSRMPPATTEDISKATETFASTLSASSSEETSSISTSTTGKSTTTTSTSTSTTSSATTENQCLKPCLPGWTEHNNNCFNLADLKQNANTKINENFFSALRVCQPDSRLTDIFIFSVENNINLIKNLISDAHLTASNVWVDTQFSKAYRWNHVATYVDLNNITYAKQSDPSTLVMAKNDYYTFRTDIYAICVRPRFCAPLTCDTGLFARYGHKYVDFPDAGSTTEFPIGSNTTLQCKADPDQPRNTTIVCQPPGFWNPNPESEDRFSCLPTPTTLPPPTTTTPFPPDDTPWNPKYFTSCIKCFELGTESCAHVDGKGWVCLCKEGWTANSCYRSPKFCPAKPCKNGGVCKENVDHAVCTCVGSWKGATCERNSARFEFWSPQVKWNNILDTVGLVGLIVGASAAGLIALIVPEPQSDFQDPQTTYQRHKAAVITVGATLMLLFRHPDILNIDRSVGARLAYYYIHSFYAATAWGMFWESVNFKNVIHIEHFNTWKDRYDKSYWWFSIYFRLPVMYLLGFMPPFITSWSFLGYVLRPWTCIGTFDWVARPLWISAIIIQLVPCWLAVIFAEGGSISLRDLLHLNVKRMYIWEIFRTMHLGTHYYFVERNWAFVFYLPIIHFFSWLSIALATDYQIIQLSIAGCVFNVIYGNLLVIQQLICRPEIYSLFIKQMMLRLSKRMAPKIDYLTWMTREEVISNHHRSAADPNYVPPTPQRLKDLNLRCWIQKYLIVRSTTKLDVRDSLNAVRLWDVDNCYTNFSCPEMMKMWQQFMAARYVDDKFNHSDPNFQKKMREAMLIHPKHLTDNPETCVVIVKHKTLKGCQDYGTKIKSPPVILWSQLVHYMQIYLRKMNEFNDEFQATVQEAEKKRAEKLADCPGAAEQLIIEMHHLAAKPLSLNQLKERIKDCPAPEVDIPHFFFNTSRPYFIGPLIRKEQPGPAASQEIRAMEYFTLEQERTWEKTKSIAAALAYRGDQCLGYFNSLKLFLGINLIQLPIRKVGSKLFGFAPNDEQIKGLRFDLANRNRLAPPQNPMAPTDCPTDLAPSALSTTGGKQLGGKGQRKTRATAVEAEQKRQLKLREQSIKEMGFVPPNYIP